jgi:ribosome-binding factor A
MSRRLTRVNELLRREIGNCLFRVMNDSGFDVSAVTITHVVASSDLRSARVMVSVRGNENEKLAALSLLRRHRADIQKVVSRNVVLKHTPRLAFVSDLSLEKGDEILEILRDLENEDIAGEQT